MEKFHDIGVRPVQDRYKKSFLSQQTFFQSTLCITHTRDSILNIIPLFTFINFTNRKMASNEELVQSMVQHAE